MFKSYIGTSTNSDAISAGKEAAMNVKAADLKAAFVYASCDYNIPEVLAAIGKELPDIPIFGNTSFTGIITPEGYIGGR